MSKRERPSRRRVPDANAAQPVVVACRGGDCGSRTKHPDTDHAGQLRDLRAGLTESASVLAGTCLDACEHSNVVVVLPGGPGRDAGGEPVWVGGVNDPDTIRDIIEWVQAGGPALAVEPTLVAIRGFRPSRLNRHELDEATGRG